jgi:hypothetical protein
VGISAKIALILWFAVERDGSVIGLLWHIFNRWLFFQKKTCLTRGPRGSIIGIVVYQYTAERSRGGSRMGGKDGRKCVFIDQALHGQLAAIVSLRAAAGEDGLSLQGLIDRVLWEWLQEHPVSGFLIDQENENDRALAIAARNLKARKGAG